MWYSGCVSLMRFDKVDVEENSMPSLNIHQIVQKNICAGGQYLGLVAHIFLLTPSSNRM